MPRNARYQPIPADNVRDRADFARYASDFARIRNDIIRLFYEIERSANGVSNLMHTAAIVKIRKKIGWMRAEFGLYRIDIVRMRLRFAPNRTKSDVIVPLGENHAKPLP